MRTTGKKHKCWECGIEETPLEEHHPVPRSRGGTRTIPLCGVCHSKAHHRKKNVSISKLTKEGLARKMASGWQAGNPRIADVGKLGRAQRTRVADEFALKLAPVVRGFQANGVSTLSGLAANLNQAGIKTVRGGKWSATAVKRLLLRIEKTS